MKLSSAKSDSKKFRRFTKKDLLAIDIDRVLDHFMVDYSYKAGEPYFLCPSPDHFDHAPSFSINTTRESERYGLGNCLSCGWGGSFYWVFSQLCENDGIVERVRVNELLFKFADDGAVEQDPDTIVHLSEDEDETYSIRDTSTELEEIDLDCFVDLKEGDKHWKYLLSRGLTPEQILKYGWMRAKNGAHLKWRRRAILPLTINNRVICLFGRAIDYERSPRTLMSKGKGLSSSVLFPYDDLDWNRPIVIVEGVPDAMTVQHASAQGCAVFKNRVSLEQANMLKRAKKIFVLGDGDGGGEVLIESCIQRLSPRDGLFICKTPPGLDPNDMGRVKIRKALIESKLSDVYTRTHVSLNRTALSYDTK